MTIVFELVDGALEVTLDGDGIAVLRHLLEGIETAGHEHLASPSWAGTELAETPRFEHSTLIHQVTFTRQPGDE